jgi:predicted RecB family nuclease
LAKILSGDQSCRFNVWLKAHFDIATRKGDFDFKAWKVDHTDLLNLRVQQLTADGWKCDVESQNYFKLVGATAVLPGKPDLIARKGARIKVVDIKTGRPQDAHGVQVAIYLTALPLVWKRAQLVLDGEVCYADHIVDVSQAMAESIAPKLFALLRALGSDVRPEPIPSQSDCRFCELRDADCPSRWTDSEAASQVVTVPDF